MPAPKFEDISKTAQDLFKDDYTTKAVAKIKYSAPANVTITSETEYKGDKLAGKLVAKWKHSSGFALDKLQISSDSKFNTETSLSGIAPGLKFNFKGDGDKQALLGAEYATPVITTTGELDVFSFQTLKFSALSAYSGFLLGGDVSLDLSAKKAKEFSYGLAYGGSGYSVGVVSKNSSVFEGSFAYALSPLITLGSLFTYKLEKSAHLVTFGGSHKCTANTTYRAKADTDGKLAAAVTHTFAKGVALTTAVETTVSNPKNATFGWTFTLG